MWRAALGLLQLLGATQTELQVSPQRCSLECLRQGRPGCEFCRVTGDDIKQFLGFKSSQTFRGCIPWPCLELLGDKDPTICEHYVQAPTDINVRFVHEPSPEYDTAVVSWKPSIYGIAFLRGFQVSLQALGGTAVSCQLLLFGRNVSLSASGAQTAYQSDPFPGLSLGSRYAVTVMALPVPERWEGFHGSLQFLTQTCAEKNGLQRCKQDWYPHHVHVRQHGAVVNVTFNLAPPTLGIRKYVFVCRGDGKETYKELVPDSSRNQTYHSFKLSDLHEGTNYTCYIAAKEVDAVRRRFRIYVADLRGSQEEAPPTPSLAAAAGLCVAAAAAAVLGLLLSAVMCWRLKTRRKRLHANPENVSLSDDQQSQKEAVLLPGDRQAPPRLLICYSGSDGAAHVNAVLQLGAFIQQHMATQVSLDLWDTLGVAEAGRMAWYCRQIRDCDFVLLVCSPGTRRGPPDVCGAVVHLIGEEVGGAKARGADLSKYMAAVFGYCEEADVPAALRLASRYALPRDLPLLFSHLQGVALHSPGSYLQVRNVSEDGFAGVPTGAALQRALQEAGRKRPEGSAGPAAEPGKLFRGDNLEN